MEFELVKLCWLAYSILGSLNTRLCGRQRGSTRVHAMHFKFLASDIQVPRALRRPLPNHPRTRGEYFQFPTSFCLPFNEILTPTSAMNAAASNFFRACRAPTAHRLIQHGPSTSTPLLVRSPKTNAHLHTRQFSSRWCRLAQATSDVQSSSTPTPTPHEASSVSPASEADASDAAAAAAATDADDAAFLSTTFSLTGHVSSVGTMRKTVRVSRTVQVWDSYLQKHYKRSTHDLVHDPHDILNEGDVITYGPFPPSLRIAREQKGQIGGKKRVRFVLREVVTPFGTPVDQRSPRVVGSPEGRWVGGPGQVQKLVVRARGKAKQSKKAQVPQTATATAKKGGAVPGAQQQRVVA